MSETDAMVLGETQLVVGPAVNVASAPKPRRPSPALIAAQLAAGLDGAAGVTVLLTTSEARADEIGRALGAIAGHPVEVLVLPAWDCLPYDHASPSRESQGKRLAVLDRLTDPTAGCRVLIASPDAALLKIPPSAVRAESFLLQVGDMLDRDTLAAFARRTGYIADDRIDEPGEIAILGEVIDIFPPTARHPLRITLADAQIETMRWFDPLSQRSQEDVDRVELRGASEVSVLADQEREPGCEHRMAQAFGPLETLFDITNEVALLAEVDVGDRFDRILDQVQEAYETAKTFGAAGLVPDPAGLYLTRTEVDAVLARAAPIEAPRDAATPPSFVTDRNPGRALKSYIVQQQERGHRVVVAATEAELRMIGRFLKRQSVVLPPPVADWDEVRSARPGALLSFVADPGAGFEDPASNLILLTATEIFGSRVAQTRSVSQSLIGEPELRVGDVVIHEDHGLAVLQALERIEVEGFERDVLRLEYHGGATVLAPVEEFGRIWRYGSEPNAVTLDRIGSESWLKRRAQVSAQIDETAARLVAMAAERDNAEAAPIRPPQQAYSTFVSRFPFPESPDQSAAIVAVLEDLASGRPMNRLVCGDVGFGKTEVALRAAAAVALSGRQVVIAAPTTVLARQHYEAFRRRFRDTGIEVAHLSRLVEGSEAAAVRSGLADGSVRIVVGTQALAADSLSFSDLGLVIIDEEQRFGSRMKDTLRARAPHALTLTATPIPRTLQSALVGLMDVSVIATPPARRRPIRTTMIDFDGASLRTALLREQRRRGQTFVVCPRIEDLGPMRERLEALVPELAVLTAHGKMPAGEVDEAMVRFADGQGDILLATNIIESGLDVPRANTIVVSRPDRFGLAQLHQLRGRVGRGRAQGFAYLLTEPEDMVPDATRARIATLEAFDRLGSGFAISAQDLELRGGGDLVGDEQAGHMKLIGATLYQRVLERAVRIARGEELPPDLAPPRINEAAFLPETFIPDATMRINLYARLARVVSASEVDALEDEIADRFGLPPEPVIALLSATRLAALAADAGVIRIASGPKATAFTLSSKRASDLRRRRSDALSGRWVEDRLVFDANEDEPHDDVFIAAVLNDLAA